MKLGVFGDVHGNIEALTAVFAVLKDAGCSAYVCLGDVVGYGASPGDCIDFIRERGISCVRGNHDHLATHPLMYRSIQPYARQALEWTRGVLPQEHMDWLAGLPLTLELEGVQFVHASLESADGSSWPYILNRQTAVFHFFIQKSSYCFFGHTHIPLLFTKDGGDIGFELLSKSKLPETAGSKYLLNPGSVGQPRDFDCRASAAIFDTDSRSVEPVRVPYDVESAQARIFAAGLPESLAQRLSVGS